MDFDIFFCRNITDEVANQKRHFTMPLQITCASALPAKMAKHENCICSLKRQNSTRRCLIFSIFWLMTHTNAALWLPTSCNQCAQLGAVMGAWFRRKEVDSTPAVGLCCTYNATVHCILGFLFRTVMLKHWIGEVGKQSIIWFLTFLPKIIVIRSCMSSERQDGTFFWDTV